MTIPTGRRVARLRLAKGMYGKQVRVNSAPVGEHTPSFTPGVFDVTAHLHGNGDPTEVTVRLGQRSTLPAGSIDGADWEQSRYTPGLYDEVDLLLHGTPYVAWIQTVPQLDAGAL